MINYKSDDRIVLTLDAGGTDSWSQYARPYDKYRLTDKHYSYGFWINIR